MNKLIIMLAIFMISFEANAIYKNSGNTVCIYKYVGFSANDIFFVTNNYDTLVPELRLKNNDTLIFISDINDIKFGLLKIRNIYILFDVSLYINSNIITVHLYTKDNSENYTVYYNIADYFVKPILNVESNYLNILNMFWLKDIRTGRGKYISIIKYLQETSNIIFHTHNLHQHDLKFQFNK